MTDKELRRLRRVELLGILIDQKKELDDLRRKLADAEKQITRSDVLIQRLLATSPVPAAGMRPQKPDEAQEANIEIPAKEAAGTAEEAAKAAEEAIEGAEEIAETAKEAAGTVPETPEAAPEAADAASEVPAVPEIPAAAPADEAPVRHYIPEPDAEDDEFIPLRVDEARRLADSQSWQRDEDDTEALNAAADAAAAAEVPVLPEDAEDPKNP